MSRDLGHRPHIAGPQSLGADACAIFEAGLDAACPRTAVKRFLDWEAPFLALDRSPAPPRLYDLSAFQRVWVLGAGKAAGTMAQGLDDLIGDQITGGLVIVPQGQGATSIGRIQLRESSHPKISAQSSATAEALSGFASGMSENDLCIALISGGASSLVFEPRAGLELSEIQGVISALSAAGATIQEINAIRRRLCSLKGGGLARLIEPAELLTLVASDIVGNPLGAIGSGLTIDGPDDSAPPLDLLETYNVSHLASHTVRRALAERSTPRPVPEHHEHRLVLDNTSALLGSAAKARALGYEAVAVTSSLVGDARGLGQLMANSAKQLLEGAGGLCPPAVLLFGGESTVHVVGDGRGGRNQELALAAMEPWASFENVVLLSAGTDGDDGGTGIAGALIDPSSASRLRAAGATIHGLLDANDSARAFELLGDQIVTGPTGTNVMDLQIIVAGPKPRLPPPLLLPG